MNLIAVTAGVCLWSGSVVGLHAMAKTDPVLSKVYVRHIKYRNFYPAHATPFAPRRAARKALKTDAPARIEAIPQPGAQFPRSVELGRLMEQELRQVKSYTGLSEPTQKEGNEFYIKSRWGFGGPAEVHPNAISAQDD